MTCSRAQEPIPEETVEGAVRRRSGLRARVEGNGPDLLLIHGLTAHLGEWDAVAMLLKDRYRVVRPDLPGRGFSIADRGMRFRLRDEVHRLSGFLDELGVADPIIVGHSHGAALAVALCSSRRARALLLVNPITPWTRRPPILELLRFEFVRRATAPLLRHYRRSLTRYILTRRVYADRALATEEAVTRYSAPFASLDRARCLARVLADWRPSELQEFDEPAAVPVQVLTGGLDRRTPPAMARRWSERLGGRCMVLDDCAHGVPEEAPEMIANLVRELDRNSAA